MEATMKHKILRQHYLFEQVERARQELYLKEQQELYYKKQQEQISREFVVSKIRRHQQQKQLQEQNKLLDLSRQRQSPSITETKYLPPSPYHHDMYYPYLHHQPAHHSQPQYQLPSPVHQTQLVTKAPVQKTVQTPTDLSKPIVKSPDSRLPTSNVHGIDRKNHDYLNGEYFCVCGTQFAEKKDLFEHIREMCKVHGAWISCML